MFFSDFDDFLRTKGKNIEDDILPQVYEIVSMCFDAAEPRLRVDPEYLKYFPFQLFGFDFLVDAEYKVWLLEINGAPAAAERLREKIAGDICSLIIDNLFCGSDDSAAPTDKHNTTDFIRI
eukprot:m.122149 g.122149  ORF g.122149 m.122149 type:complete len:121 (+) comp12934_c0_seq2:879-1241(+)